MSVFDKYSRYYDLLYREKDYAGEVGFVAGLLDAHAPGARSLLDLGCGTGVHASIFAERGFRVVGVDRSQEMLAAATARRGRLNDVVSERLQFVPGDVRSLAIGERFDVVTALFHVMSYQETNADLQAALARVRAHLEPGGLFVFDFWYGPAVLTDRPVARMKELEDEKTRVLRFARSGIEYNANVVDVHYHLVVLDKEDYCSHELQENHRMRYLFKPELDLLLAASDLTTVHFSEWMTGREPDERAWNVVVAARAGSTGHGARA